MYIISNMDLFLKRISIIFVLLLMVISSGYAQVRFIDNKGTINTISGTPSSPNSTITLSGTPLNSIFYNVGFDISPSPSFLTKMVLITNISGDVVWVTQASLEHTGTAGSIFFADAVTGAPTENNAQFFWDATNNRLGIGTNTPTHKLQVVGQVRATSMANADGTAGSPAYRFWNDGNTGVFRAAADQLGFTTGGTEVFRIDASQNVGIGTTNPDNRLHVTATSDPIKLEGLQNQATDSILMVNGNGVAKYMSTSALADSINAGDNIYNIDSVLTGNRTMTMDGHSLTFNETDGFTKFNDPTFRTQKTWGDGKTTAIELREWDMLIESDRTWNEIRVHSDNTQMYFGTYDTEEEIYINGQAANPSNVNIVTGTGNHNIRIDKDNGNVGIGLNRVDATTKLDVNGGARVRDLTGYASTDSIVTADTDGNLHRSDFTLSGLAETVTSITQATGNADSDVTSGDANTIATYTNENGSDTTINETVTVLEESTTDDLEYEYINETKDTVAFRSSPIVAFGKVNSSGTLLRGYGATVSRNSRGNYTVTLSTARSTANYTIQLTVRDSNGAGNDDYDLAYSGQTTSSFVVEVGDNDNGGGNRANRDFEFMFTVIDY